MALTDTAIKKAKGRKKEWKLPDEKGLYLLITPSGSKLWRYKFRFAGKEKKLALGKYPEVSLKSARQKRNHARLCLEDGHDPSLLRKKEKWANKIGASNTFKAVAEAYLKKMEREGRSETTMKKARWLLSKLAPQIGTRPIADIAPFELLEILEKVQEKGHLETARRLRSFASRVFRFGVQTAKTETNPAEPLKGALTAPKVKHHAAITDPQKFGELLRAIDQYGGQPSTIYALKLTAHLFQRPGEMRQAEWAEIDFENAVWSIPASRMKQSRPHRVPLSKQAAQLFLEVRNYTGNSKYVFPGQGNQDVPMSENTVNQALRRMGFSHKEMTAHGFRGTASSLLNESRKWHPDTIERALSHEDKNQVRKAYNHSEYWDERILMAQWWSDYIDQLTVGGQIVPLFEEASSR